MKQVNIFLVCSWNWWKCFKKEWSLINALFNIESILSFYFRNHSKLLITGKVICDQWWAFKVHFKDQLRFANLITIFVFSVEFIIAKCQFKKSLVNLTPTFFIMNWKLRSQSKVLSHRWFKIKINFFSKTRYKPKP